MNDGILEVIACTLEDAIEAELGGANRLEVVSRFDLGGLTPSVELVAEIRARVSIPLRVMLRESESYRLSDPKEIEKLCAKAGELDELGVDGLVLGFLVNGGIDRELVKRILANAPNLKATFHHAFEETNDKFTAVEKLKAIPQIDRVLTHCGSGKWLEKCRLLEEYRRAANPQIKILAGGAVNASVIRLLRKRTAVNEFHVGTAAREFGVVKKKRVAKLVEAIDGD